MSARPDAGLRRLIHRSLGKPEWDWRSVETGSTAAGLPDGVGLHRTTGRVVWVESKRTEHWAVKFEPHQLGWWRVWGPHVQGFVAVRASGKNQTDGLGDGLYLYAGVDADRLDLEGLRAPPLLRLVGPARSWNWNQVARVLTSD